jgi:hypothetical protein
MLDKLTSTDFAAHLHSSFRIHGGDLDSVAAEAMLPLEAELIEVTELGVGVPSAQESAQRRPFSILFRAPPNSVLPQGIYPVVHPELGTLSLFLVPLGPDRVGMRYEAVFT